MPDEEMDLGAARRQWRHEVALNVGAGGRSFSEHVVGQFEEVKSFLANRPLEIARVTGTRQFVIGDCPAVTWDAPRSAAGTINGVGLRSADTVVMPVGPTMLLAAGGGNRYVDIDPDVVDHLNRMQLDNAAERLYTQPGSAMDDWLKVEAAKLRPPRTGGH